MIKKTGTFDNFRETLDKLSNDGVLLIAGDPPNLMTIGWGTLGIIWGKEMMTVMVRPTRFTFGLMEKSSEFSVCVLPERFSKELAFCGSRSGRDIDKIKACGFTMLKGITIPVPFIAESLYHYECRIIHKHFLDPETLDPVIIKRYYPKRDYHMVYYGEIVGCYKNYEL